MGSLLDALPASSCLSVLPTDELSFRFPLKHFIDVETKAQIEIETDTLFLVALQRVLEAAEL